MIWLFPPRAVFPEHDLSRSVTVGFYCQRGFSGILSEVSDCFLGNELSQGAGGAGNLAGFPSEFVGIVFEAEGM